MAMVRYLPNFGGEILFPFRILSGGSRFSSVQGLHDFIKVEAHRNLIIQKILEPDEVHPLGHSNKREKIPKPHPDFGLRAFGSLILGRSIQLESHSHV
jgi:hypothetical protein